MPAGPPNAAKKRGALLRFARSYLDREEKFPALMDLIERRPPRADLTRSVPEPRSPWTARTSSSRVRPEPARPGERQGRGGADAGGAAHRVSANSHKGHPQAAREIESEAARSIRRLSRAQETLGRRRRVLGLFIESTDDFDAMLDPELLLDAGTSWLFAYEELEGHVDTLFLDEAGQISLADALVCGTAARNLILLGDPNQLPQVSKGAQPEEAKVSVLQYLLGESVTVPEGRGIFLPETWRLRPELCEFTSRAYYDGRLSAAQVCARRDLSAGNGLAVLAVSAAWVWSVLTRGGARDRRRGSCLARHRPHGRTRRPLARGAGRAGGGAVQRAGTCAAHRAACRCPRGNGGQVPGPGGGGGVRLVRQLEQGGRAARDRFHVRPPSRQRRHFARAVPQRDRLLAATARCRVPQDRADAIDERGVPVRGDGRGARAPGGGKAKRRPGRGRRQRISSLLPARAAPTAARAPVLRPSSARSTPRSAERRRGWPATPPHEPRPGTHRRPAWPPGVRHVMHGDAHVAGARQREPEARAATGFAPATANDSAAGVSPSTVATRARIGDDVRERRLGHPLNARLSMLQPAAPVTGRSRRGNGSGPSVRRRRWPGSPWHWRARDSRDSGPRRRDGPPADWLTRW